MQFFSLFTLGGTTTSNARTFLVCKKEKHFRNVCNSACDCIQELEMRNMDLERRVQSAEQSLASTLEDRDRTENEVQRVIQILDIKLFDLNDLRQSLVKLLEK